MDLPFDCGKQMIQVIRSYPKDFWIMFLFTLYGGMMPPSALIIFLINNELSKYVELWKMGMCKDETYARKLGPYVAYWENILELLSNLLPIQNSTFLEGF
jgi:hypothetical protein